MSDTLPPRNPSADVLVQLVDAATDASAFDLHRVVDLAGTLLGAGSAHLLVADYALRTFRQLGPEGPVGEPRSLEGTLAGRAFATGELAVSGTDPTMVCIPLSDHGDRIGVVELEVEGWGDDQAAVAVQVQALLPLVLVTNRRHTDVLLRARRSRPLSPAAEMQWDLLPPQTGSTAEVSVSGTLEPAYEVGGDSFDFAFNPGRLDFAIVDAVGHGIAAVLMSVAAINGLRNSRRDGANLVTTYLAVSRIIESQFSPGTFVTGQFGSLLLGTGELTWINAGHPLPLLVRDGTSIGPLVCAPSMPLGLGDRVEEVRTTSLQPGDRLLFHTDGVIETRTPDGVEFGVDRLADHLVRASLDQTPAPETVRRIIQSVMTHNDSHLVDDATLLLIDYAGPDTDTG
jgi:serine phosphatase RsbU (regulator of sigma subunit)